MAVRFNINERTIQVKIDNAWKSGLEMLSSVILQDCNRYCKQESGALIMSSYVHSKLAQGRLIWQTPYAAIQYYKIPTAYKEINANASWRWCEVAKGLHLADWQKQAQEITRLYK